MTVNILGTDYDVVISTAEKEPKLSDCDGYCDKTSKRIVVCDKDDTCDLDDFDWYLKKCLRHEIIHAFMFESGLHENWQHQKFGQEETTVDWIATQFPKMLKAFQDAGCIAEMERRNAGCDKCANTFFTSKPFRVEAQHGYMVDAVFNYCPVCGKKLQRHDER